MIKIEVKTGQEVIETVEKYLKENHIKEGSIVIIGGIDECSISTMPKNDAKKVIIKKYHEPLELSGTGEVIDGKPHLHVVLGRADQTVLMGHLEWAKVKTWYVNIYITPLD